MPHFSSLTGLRAALTASCVILAAGLTGCELGGGPAETPEPTASASPSAAPAAAEGPATEIITVNPWNADGTLRAGVKVVSDKSHEEQGEVDGVSQFGKGTGTFDVLPKYLGLSACVMSPTDPTTAACLQDAAGLGVNLAAVTGDGATPDNTTGIPFMVQTTDGVTCTPWSTSGTHFTYEDGRVPIYACGEGKGAFGFADDTSGNPKARINMDKPAWTIDIGNAGENTDYSPTTHTIARVVYVTGDEPKGMESLVGSAAGSSDPAPTQTAAPADDCPSAPDGIDAEVCHGMPADAQPGPDAMVAPSGNIGCDWTHGGNVSDSIACYALEHDFEAGTGEGGVGMCVGSYVRADGEAAVFCPSGAGAWQFEPATQLAYGSAYSFGSNIACRMREDNGLTCWNTESGHGFNLQRSQNIQW